MADKVLSYGDGVNWSGTAAGLTATMRFRVQFGIAGQEVPFQVQAGQSALLTAVALMNTWNDNWSGEASMPTATEAIVRFAKQGQEVKLMQVAADSGAWKDLPATVNGYDVTNVQ